jgi:hypothetical protein
MVALNDVSAPVDVMARIGALLKLAQPKFNSDQRPISFDFGTEVWTFDPMRPQVIFLGHPDRPALLTIRTTAPLLWRLLSEPDFYLANAEKVVLEGDPIGLKQLAQYFTSNP